MQLFKQYLEQSSFGSYEDYLKNFRIQAPDHFNFAYDVLERLAQETPDAVALEWCNVEGEAKTFTFKDIAEQSSRAANLFQSLGVQRGDAVMLVLKRHYQFWFAIMGLHKLGAVAVPATHLLTKKDIVYRCNAATVKMIVATSEGVFHQQCDLAMAECPTVAKRLSVRGSIDGWINFDEELQKQSPVFGRPEPLNENSDPLLLYFTSGTSGMPKMVIHDCTYPLGHIQTAAFWQECEDNGLHLTVSETGWAKSVWGKLYGQWLCGSAIMVYDFEKFVPKDLLNIVSKYHVTSFCAPPTIYRFMMLEEGIKQLDLSALRHCSVAGEPLSPEVFDGWLSLTGVPLREAFGQTELCVTVGTFPWMKSIPGSMGKPSPQFDVDIVDDDGNSCAAGVVGEIVVRTRKKQVGMFGGYYRDEERTASVWHDDIYHTLDLAWRDEWGYYWYVGRADDVIKSSGYRIGPFEVESALMEHPAVLETAITGVPDEVRGQVVKATIVLRKGFEPSDALIRELQDHVKKTTAPYKYPRIIEFAAELPKTISGKIRRVELRERDKQA